MSLLTRADFRENDIRLFQTGNFADGTVECKGRTWKVHRTLLASRLKFFRKAFFGPFEEATIKEVKFPESDPDLVDIMLRHLYGEDIDVKQLDTPVLCIRCWRLADYLQLKGLQGVAISSLGQHLDAMALLAFNNRHWVERDDGQLVGIDHDGPQPKWLTHLLAAFREVCVDVATKPLLPTSVAFLWVTRFELLEVQEVEDCLHQCRNLDDGLRRLLVRGGFSLPAEPPAWLPSSHRGHVIRQIRDRMGCPPDGFFESRDFCWECYEEVTDDQTLYSNPFPIGEFEIQEVTWCHECVAKFNRRCYWPWRRGTWRGPEDRVNLAAWTW